MRALLAVALLVPSLALAQVPGKLGFQGRLLTSAGAPETGSKNFGFKLFPTETGGAGTEVWSETQNLALTDGYYATHLGDDTDNFRSKFTGADLFLEVSVEGTPLTPRQRVGSVAYSIFAGTAKNVSGGTVNATAITGTSLTVGGATVIDSTGKVASTAVQTGPGIAVNGSGQVALKTCGADEILKSSGTDWTCAAGYAPVSTLDGYYVKKAGDTMTGNLTISNAGNAGIELRQGTPYIDFSTDTVADNQGRLILRTANKLSFENAAVSVETTKVSQDNIGNVTTTTTTRSLKRLVMQNNRRRETVAIPQATLVELCGNGDGCMVTIGMRNWSTTTGQPALASRGPFLFDYDGATGRWRISNTDDTAVDGDGTNTHVLGPWSCCYFTESQYISGVEQPDNAKQMYLLNWADATYCPNSAGNALSCTLIIDD